MTEKRQKPRKKPAFSSKIVVLTILVALGGLTTGKLLAGLSFPSLISSITKTDTEAKDTDAGSRLVEKPFAFLSTQQQQQLKSLRQDMNQTAKDNNVEYLAAPVHSGPLIQVMDITVSYTATNTAQAITTKKHADQIQIKQDVILYDKDGYILPLGGQVNAISPIPNDDNNATITITLPDGTNTDLLSTTQGIITTETLPVRRLPFTALQYDEQGKSYIWRIALETLENGTPDTDTHTNATHEKTLKRFYLDITTAQKGDSYFTAPYKINTHDLIILNPKNNTRSGKVYKVAAVDMNAPITNPIKEAWNQYQNYVQAQNKKAHDIALYNCQNGIPTVQEGDISTAQGPQNVANTQNGTNGGNNGGACGGGLSLNDPAAIFRQLTAPTTGSCNNSCGG